MCRLNLRRLGRCVVLGEGKDDNVGLWYLFLFACVLENTTDDVYMAFWIFDVVIIDNFENLDDLPAPSPTVPFSCFRKPFLEGLEFFDRSDDRA